MKTLTTNPAAAHTPGPWSVTAGKKHEMEIYGPNGLVVATTYDCDDSFPAIGTSGVEQANARLIASCPEMLEMLLEALPLVEEGEQYHKASCRTLSKRIRALLEANP